MSLYRTPAEAFDAAMAELARVRPLFLGPLTAQRQDLIARRLNLANIALGQARLLTLRARPDADPLPSRTATAGADNLIPYRPRHRS